MRKGILSLTAAAAAMTLGLTACGSDNADTGAQTSAAPAESTAAAAGKVGVILPDSKSSARWETADRKYLSDAFKAAGVKYDIQNAQGDKSAVPDHRRPDDHQRGATVLMIVNLDSGTGKAVLDKAKSQGVATIDYDRLTLGGGAQYYVSFDNTKVGQLQGQGLVKCLTAKGAQKPIIAELNGSPTDNNATLFKNGYDSRAQAEVRLRRLRQGPRPVRPDWDNAQAATIFEQMLTQQPQDRRRARRQRRPRQRRHRGAQEAALNGKVPVTGQDATVQGLQNILAGDQCMTVYKADQEGGRRGRRRWRSRWPRGRSRASPARSRTRRPSRRRAVGPADPGRDHQGQRQGRRRRTASSPRPRNCAPAQYAAMCTAAGIK